MKLSKDRFEKARWFIRTQARRLDRLLYEFYFEKGSTEYVLNELANYQNPDGGFGHAIEPDIRLQASSPMATSVGLQYCVSMNTKAENQVVKSAIAYLLSTYDAQEEYWPQTFMNVNDEPHAPWWHLDELKPPEEQNWPNPSAELAGYLHRYSILVPSDFIEIVT
jgi:hypothetical protein